MKFEANEINFSANMNLPPENDNRDVFKGFGAYAKENKTMFLAVIACVIAFANLGFGLFVNLGRKILVNIFANTITYHFITVMLVLSIVLGAVSVVLGIFAINNYFKSQKQTMDKVAVFLASLAFAVAAVSLTLDIVGLVI